MKKFSINIIIPVLITGFILVIAGCKKTPPIDTSTFLDKMLKLATTESAVTGYHIEIFGRDSFYVGYNPLYLKVTDKTSGEMVTDAQIKLKPMMDMGAMKHTSPFENPGSVADTEKVFSCAVVFTMPSTAGTWTLDLILHNKNTLKYDTIMLPINVKAPANALLKSVISLKDGSTYFISLLEPLKPKTGINDLELTIHKKQDMMNFPAVDGLTIGMEPEMPAMGHGSPNNVDPAFIQNGHYKGKVNFTMSGLWHINLDIFDGADAIDTTTYFVIDFL